jgi:hypothetical protein
VRQVAEYYSEYKQCFEGAGTNPGEKTLEDKFFEYEVLLIRGHYSSLLFFKSTFAKPSMADPVTVS